MPREERGEKGEGRGQKERYMGGGGKERERKEREERDRERRERETNSMSPTCRRCSVPALWYARRIKTNKDRKAEREGERKISIYRATAARRTQATTQHTAKQVVVLVMCQGINTMCTPCCALACSNNWSSSACRCCGPILKPLERQQRAMSCLLACAATGEVQTLLKQANNQTSASTHTHTHTDMHTQTHTEAQAQAKA